ncbi:hypothetical protein [Paenibacillus sp. YYML68]|uniref:hypothetical protein n=1 Tax=Paenibacillus sp. YYML68 TaxID=2909250 RepID=UPI002490229D|nr:hypothetical protein [Paenibacillus sp. YYML68]
MRETLRELLERLCQPHSQWQPPDVTPALLDECDDWWIVRIADALLVYRSRDVDRDGNIGEGAEPVARIYSKARADRRSLRTCVLHDSSEKTIIHNGHAYIVTHEFTEQHVWAYRELEHGFIELYRCVNGAVHTEIVVVSILQHVFAVREGVQQQLRDERQRYVTDRHSLTEDEATAELHLDGQSLELLAMAAEQMCRGQDYRSRQYGILARKLRDCKRSFHAYHASRFSDRFGLHGQALNS